MALKGTERRKHVRFPPDAGVYAAVDPNSKGSKFMPVHLALVSDEAHKGCGLVLLNTDQLQMGDQCKVKVGQIGPVQAEVRWRLQIDPTVIKIGLVYNE